MRYIITNINKLVVATAKLQNKSYIYVAGCVDKANDSHSDGFLYTNNISEAKSFDNEQQAWFYIYDMYGMDYGRRTFAVLSVKQEALDNLSRINIGENNG